MRAQGKGIEKGQKNRTKVVPTRNKTKVVVMVVMVGRKY
jgi:hypothetical protein